MLWLYFIVTMLLFEAAMAFDVVGSIKFAGGAPDTLKPGSWLTVKVEDTTIMDASSILLGETQYQIKGYNKNKPLTYKITGAKKPSRKSPEVSVSAYINAKKPTKDDWIAREDYLTQTAQTLNYSDNETSYTKDIEVEYYE